MMRIARAQGDFEKSALFAKRHLSPGNEINKIEKAYSVSVLAGGHQEAYELSLSQEDDCGGHVLYWFNRACYASLCGEFEDAIVSLSRCLEPQSHFIADAFLDPDLQPLGDFLSKASLDLRRAEYFVDRRWRQTGIGKGVAAPYQSITSHGRSCASATVRQTSLPSMTLMPLRSPGSRCTASSSG